MKNITILFKRISLLFLVSILSLGCNQHKDLQKDHSNFNYRPTKDTNTIKSNVTKDIWEWFNYKEKKWIEFSLKISKLIDVQYTQKPENQKGDFKIYKARAIQICGKNGYLTHSNNKADIDKAKLIYKDCVSEHMHRTLIYSDGKWRYFKQGFNNLDSELANKINDNINKVDSNNFICSYDIHGKKYYIYKANALIEYKNSPWNRAAIRKKSFKT